MIEVSAAADPNASPRRRRISALRLTRRRTIVALAVAVLAAAATLAGERDSRRHGTSALAHESGAAGVAAAYGYPPRCLSVTILVTDHTYARADFNHVSPCGRYTWDPTAIFHRVAGAWRLVLHAVGYSCPVRSLPAAVQEQLGVCAAIKRT